MALVDNHELLSEETERGRRCQNILKSQRPYEASSKSESCSSTHMPSRNRPKGLGRQMRPDILCQTPRLLCQKRTLRDPLSTPNSEGRRVQSSSSSPLPCRYLHTREAFVTRVEAAITSSVSFHCLLLELRLHFPLFPILEGRDCTVVELLWQASEGAEIAGEIMGY